MCNALLLVGILTNDIKSNIKQLSEFDISEVLNTIKFNKIYYGKILNII